MSNNLILKLDLDADWRADWGDYTVRIKNVLGGYLVDITSHLAVGTNGHVEYEWRFDSEKQRAWWMAYANFYLDVYYKKKRVSTEISLKEYADWSWYSLTPSQRIKDGHRDKGFKSDKASYDKQIAVNAAIKLMGTKGTSKSTKQDQSKTTKTQKIPDGVEKSGIQWVSRYPNNNSLEILKEPFRTGAKGFIKAMKDAGVSVKISVVYRPPERAYLMYFATYITRGKFDPLNIKKSTEFPGVGPVNIDWAHLDKDGKPDKEAALAAAKAMYVAYKIGKNPVAVPGVTNHIGREAIDMTITGYEGKEIKDATGNLVKVSSFNGLKTVGATYGLFHLLGNDPPHWSRSGR